jgi:DNA-binding response OmpR family regulator
MEKKIVLIEDDNMLREMYQTKLRSDGFNVLSADNGGDGWKMVEKEVPDLVLLDIILPQLDGFSVLELIKKTKQTKDVKVVMLTNLGTEEDHKKGEAMGAVDYLIKANMTPDQVSKVASKYLKS